MLLVILYTCVSC